ncbi:KLHL17 [Branchiostoma lanceolatum]|uniref:KLHL17 protein n=1 Tax=Branchiostoma lanceolatum TaxID=7740 RepID=A0A8K0EYE7_BRALA|nr:KLHL17 [Branchiostoma lanceolatum]
MSDCSPGSSVSLPSAGEACQPDHCTEILGRLQWQRREGRFTDMVVSVGGWDFHAHRNVLAACSPYFDALYDSNMTESQTNHIALTCATPAAMEQILDFIYTGRADINEGNVEDILRGSDHLMLERLRARCADFLGNHITAGNCLGVRSLASVYNIKDLLDTSKRYIQNNFNDMVQGEEVLQLPFGQLRDLIADDRLRVLREETVFELIVRWTRHDIQHRRHLFPRLMSQIRLAEIDKEYLLDCVETEELVGQSPKCRSYLMEVFENSNYPDSLTVSPRLIPRQGRLITAVVVLGGKSKKGRISSTLAYVLEEQRWASLAPLPCKVCSHSVTVLDGCLYVAGGKLSRTTTSNRAVYMFDPFSNTWQGMPDMQTPRAYPALAACDGRLFAMGGENGGVIHNSVECLDLSNPSKKWTFVAPMRTGRCLFETATVDDRFIYAISGLKEGNIVSSSVEMYDTVCDRWRNVPPGISRFHYVPVARVIKGNIYLFVEGSDVVRYSPREDTWEATNERVPVMHFSGQRVLYACCVVGEETFVCGGRDLHNQTKVFSTACTYRRGDRRWRPVSAPPITTVASAACVLRVPYEYLQ